MSTRSWIGYYHSDNKEFEYVYCHYDGYPSYTGNVLKDYYNDIYRVMDLVNLGAMSCLKKLLTPDIRKEHNFLNRQDDVTVFYHRDRGDVVSQTSKMVMDQIDLQDAKDGFIEFIYTYYLDRGWVCIDVRSNEEFTIE